MQVVLLAGGMGTRIRSVAGDMPKALLPIAGRPFIDHQLDWLASHGVSDLLVCAGYGGDQLQAHVGQGEAWGLTIKFVFEDPNALLGTGGAVLGAWDHLEDRFMTLYGDSYLPTDCQAVFDAFEQRSEPAMMTVFFNPEAWDPSNVRIADGKVIFYEKGADPASVDYIDYGMTLFTKDSLNPYLDQARPLDLSRIQGDLVKSGQMAAFEVAERYYEIGKPSGYEELDAYLKGDS